MADLLRAVAQRDGIAAALELSDRLMRRGFEVARVSGASIGPFVGEGFAYPPQPQSDDPAAWERYAQELIERIAAHTDLSGDLGVLTLMSRSGARANPRLLAWALGARGAVTDANGQQVAVRHGYRDGLTPTELFALIASTRAALYNLLQEWDSLGHQMRERVASSRGYGALARAMRSPRPGIVFALAAASGEADSLSELDSRLFVGLPGSIA
jgi:hypothetical protein